MQDATLKAVAQVRELIAAQHELEASMKLFEAAVARGDQARMIAGRKTCHEVLDKILNGKEISFTMAMQQHFPGTTQ